MSVFEDIKLYLPKYLTAESEKTLFEELKQFPPNIDKLLYTTYLKNTNFLYQGDGIEGLLYVNFPQTKIDKVPAMIISNTCDIDPANRRFIPPNMIYSPIINLEKYRKALLENENNHKKIDDHINSIRNQQVTSVFYLPKGGSLKTEFLVFFDRINSCSIDYIKKNEIIDQRLFTLSNYGLYFFIIKLSIHFTRVTEGIDRDNHNLH